MGKSTSKRRPKERFSKLPVSIMGSISQRGESGGQDQAAGVKYRDPRFAGSSGGPSAGKTGSHFD